MSHNQSRAERSDSAPYRKTGRSGSSTQQRNFPAGVNTKGGGGASSTPSNFGGRSFKKYNNNNNNNSNGQGGQSRARSPNVDSDSAANPLHQPTQSVPDVPVTSSSSNVMPTDASSQKISRAVPKAPSSNVPTAAPTSNVPAANPEHAPPTTPVKGDASKSFPLQFGSISPGLMNGVQIPARTSSAPPNLDEQKQEQARRELLRTAPSIPVPSIPKHHLQKKDDQNNTVEPQSVSKPKRDPQISAAAAAPPPQVTQTQKPAVHSIPGMPMQLPYHQPQVPVQFGGPGPQIQSQPMSLPMQMQLPIGNPQMQQPMFITGLQPHPLQSQGIMHQGQNFNFSAPMSHQLPPQMGNLGINMGPPQFPQQQQAGKYGGGIVPRKPVKITHPDTHEELRLDGSSGPRSHSNVPPQSQPIASFPPNHPMGFYPNSYNPGNVYFPAASSVSMNSNLVPPTSQPLRISKQVTVKAPVVSHVEKEPLPTKIPISVGKAESKEPVSVRPPKEADPSSLSSLPQPKHDLVTLKRSPDEESNAVVVSAPIKDNSNESVNIGKQDQVDRPLSEAEAVNAKSTLPATDLVPKTDNKLLSTTVGTLSLASSTLTSEGNAEMKTDDVSRSVGTKIISRQSEPEIVSESSKSDEHSPETSLKYLSLESLEITGKESSDQEVKTDIVGLSKPTDENPDDVKMTDKIVMSDDKTLTESDEVNKESDPVFVSSHTEVSLKPENDDNDNNSAVPVSLPSSIVKDKVLSDANAGKGAAPRGKKKKKDLYKKAEAAGASSDLYNAYKGPEEKKEPAESTETHAEVSHENDSSNEKPAQGKVEPDDWEDAAENTPQLGASKNENLDNDGDGNGLITKKYSRDFLLKFEDQIVDLPEGFKIPPEVADALMASSNFVRESHPSPGRNVDRPNSRSDRRSSGLGDEDKWNKSPGPLMSGRGDMSTDAGYYSGNNIIGGFRPGQGGNYGVLRNPRPQAPVHYPVGIMPGPMQFLGPQGGGPQRNNAESDRWLRGTNIVKGLMPHPQAPVPIMHRAEKKYEIGKVTDEEQAKQRLLKGILNKLTPQNFEKLFQQVKEVNIDNVVTLSGVISQIFDKALMEPTFCEMYADFCFHLAADLPELSVDNEKITFKRLLLNKCQEEFERGEREEEEANKAEEEGECKQTPEEREENRLRVRRRMLGNIRLIGELYKKRMLTERIMHECINKLLGQYDDPDEENIEALCKLMSTIGEMIDHPKAKDFMDAYFDIMTQLSNNMRLSSRVRFMLRDSIDLRRNKWQQRRKVEGPKKIEELHRDAAQERHAQSSRLSRAPNMGSSARRGPPMEFAPRGAPSMISSSPGPQMGGGFRSGTPQARGGYGFSQDARSDAFENNRAMPVPLPQRPLGDDNITLGPQGGLVRGMGFRGQQSPGGVHLAEMSSPGDARRVGPGLNGFNSMPERVSYGQREDLVPRYGPDSRFVAPSGYDSQVGNREVTNMDHGFDRSLLASPPQGGPPSSLHDVSSDKVWPEEQLRDKSMLTIEEFYSARDKNEVALCIKDLKTPSFYPSMISIWLADSFERKDKEREVLTDLLINLSKLQGIITEDHLIKGFESVLAVLEDAVHDAPRAPEFLGHTFARVILENIVSLSEIGRLIYEGGEEQGRLVEIGLAADVLGSTLDTIKSEKGDTVLNDIRSGSNLQLENFRPLGSKETLKIDKFM